MPTVKILRAFPDDDQVLVEVSVEESHPDGLLAETARVAVETFAAAHGVVLTAIDDETTGE